MANHDQNDQTVLSQPTACPKCGALPSDACAKTGGWCEDVSRRLVVHIGQPAAPLSPQEIAEMRARVNAATPGPWEFISSLTNWHDHTFEMEWLPNGTPDRGGDNGVNENYRADGLFMAHARSDMPRLLDAIETLTAERDGAVAAGNAETSRLLVMIRDQAAENARLTSERDTLRDAVAEGGQIIDGLRAEVERLTKQAEIADAVLAQAEGEVKDLQFELCAERRASQEMAKQYLADFGQRYQPETYATAGIDMALLGQLCSEEPDADTKREVAEVMETIRMARESSKDGD